MSKDVNEEKKAEIIYNLKESIENTLFKNFVDEYEMWNLNMQFVNSMINHVDPEIPVYTYNDFCKKIIEITKNSLNKIVDYDKLFLTNEEYSKIVSENKDGNIAKQILTEELNKKYNENLSLVLSKTQIKESIQYKLKDKYTSDIDNKLNGSISIANMMLEKFKEDKNNIHM